MSKRIDPALIDHAIKLILETKCTWNHAAATINICVGAMKKHILARNIRVPKYSAAGKHIKQLPNNLIKTMIREYIDGANVVTLAKKYNLGRGIVRRRLKQQGIKIRTQSEASVVAMSNLTPEQRKKRVQSANNALRGAKQPRGRRRKRANGVETITYKHMIGLGEKEFTEFLTNKRIKFTWQKAVDIYNIDFLIGNVAVELRKNISNATGDVKRGRVEKLRKCGYISLYVRFKTIEELIGCMDYVITKVDQLNRYPSPLGQYWVIVSRTKRFSRTRNNKGQIVCEAASPQLFTTCRKRYY